jgi:hypothetical protein
MRIGANFALREKRGDANCLRHATSVLFIAGTLMKMELFGLLSETLVI